MGTWKIVVGMEVCKTSWLLLRFDLQSRLSKHVSLIARRVGGANTHWNAGPNPASSPNLVDINDDLFP
jgi:hypothetical protein